MRAATAAIALAIAIVPALALGDVGGGDPALPSPQAIKQAFDEQRDAQQDFEGALQSPEAVNARDQSQTAYVDASDTEAQNVFTKSFGDLLASDSQFPVDPGQVKQYLSDHVAVVEKDAQSSTDQSQSSDSSAANSVPTADQRPAEPSAGQAADVTGPKVGLIDSSLPLRTLDEQGQDAPVDLTLQQQDGAFAPANPVVDASLPIQLGSGFHVGGASGIGVEPVGLDQGVQAKRVDDNSVMYPNVDDSRDLIASVRPQGFELSTQIRSLDAPEAQSYHLDLPSGAELQAQPDGSITAVQANQVIGRVEPPQALDAQGQQVPVSMQIVGSSSVTVQAQFHGGDYALPILVDPVVDSYFNGAFGTTLWPIYQTAGSPAYACPGPNGLCGFWPDGSLNIGEPSGTYPGGAAVEKYWNVPNGTSNPDSTTAWVQAASFSGVTFQGNANQAAWPFFLAGIWNTRNNSWNLDRINTGDQSFSNASFTLTQTGSYPGPIDDGQEITFVLMDYSGSPIYHNAWTTASDTGGITMNITDPDSPTIPANGVSASPSASTWTDKGLITVSVTSHDNGLGVYQDSLFVPTVGGSLDFGAPVMYGSPAVITHNNCTGARTAPCSQDWTGTFSGANAIDAASPGVAEGDNQALVWSTDPLGNVAGTENGTNHIGGSNTEIKVDHSGPKLDLSGSLTDAPNGSLQAQPYDLHVQARDGSSQSPDLYRSGVHDLKVYLNDPSGTDQTKLLANTLGQTTVSNASCGPPANPGYSCELPNNSLDYHVDVPSLIPTRMHTGHNTLTIVSTDFATNSSDQLPNKTIKTISLNVSGPAGAIITPKAGDTTPRRFELSAERRDPAMNYVTFQYRKPGTSQWTDVPAANLTLDSDGSHPPATQTGGAQLALDGNGKTPPVTWDVPSTTGLQVYGNVPDGEINMRARFSTGTPVQRSSDNAALFWRLGEPEGTTAADSSGNEQAGTYVVGTGTVPAMHNADGPSQLGSDDDGAVTLDGTSQYVKAGYSPFVPGSTRTFTGWAKRSSTGTPDTLFGGVAAADQTSSGAPRLVIAPANQSGAADVSWTPMGTYFNHQPVIWANAWPGPTGGANPWVHWALVVTEPTQGSGGAESAELFINGTDAQGHDIFVSQGVRTSSPATYIDQPQPLVLGAWAHDGTSFQDYFAGSLDEFAVYEGGLVPSDIQALAASGPQKGFSQTVPVTLSRDATTSKHASASVGPGTLDLETGNFSVTQDDVSIKSWGSDLTVSRTFNSRAPLAGLWAGFGAGWTTSIPVDSASSDYVTLSDHGASVAVTESDGTEILFSKNPDGSYTVEPMYSGLQLIAPDSSRFVLTDFDGSNTTFYRPTGSSTFVPLKATQTGSAAQNTTRYGYGTRSGQPYPTFALAPTPAGISCTTDSGGNLQLLSPLPRGCRALLFHYSNHGPNGAFWLVDSISFEAWDPVPGQMKDTPVADYAYDATSHLLAEWDPRVSQSPSCGGTTCPDLKTNYTYDPNSWQLSGITPPGQNAWSFTYEASQGFAVSGRLLTASRSMPSVGNATTTVQYGVSLSSPWNMSPSTVSTWHQSDAPVDATAVIPPNPTSGVAQSDLTKATIYYMNRNGDLVNQASPTTNPSGEISTLQYGNHRNVISQLTPQNRLTALAAGSSSSATADVLETDTVFSADGVDPLETFGPEHQVQLANGSFAQARQHSVTTYDEGRPTGQDYHLPTTQVVGARLCTGLSCPMTAGSSSDVETRTTQTAYNWALRQSTQVTVDPGTGSHLNLVSKTTYDSASGLTTSSSTPKANAAGNDAHTTNTIYYSAATQSSDPVCQNKPEWANLPCKTKAAGQPTGGAPNVPETTYQYKDMWDDSTQVTDAVGAVTRTATTGYDNAGRPTSSTFTTTGSNVGTQVPDVTTAYDPNKGLPTTTSSSAGTITRGYDMVGRQASYTDADGKTTTTTYGNLNGPTVTTTSLLSGSATDNYTYDNTTGRISQMVDSQAGTFAATSYDGNGALTSETMPNGLTLQNTYDATGSPTTRSYTLGSSQVMQFTQNQSIQGQITSQSTSVASNLSESDTEVYDAAGRLVQSLDSTPSGGCGVQNYAYDADSNRSSQRSVTAIPGGSCDTNPNDGTLTSHSYDEADRLLSSGSGNTYTYDPFGRATSVPAADAGGSALTASYYVNDRVRSMTQGSVTKTFTNDPAGRVHLTQTTGQSDQIDHFSSDGDSPSWTAIGSSNWQRYIGDLDGSLCAVQQGVGGTNGTLSYELTNLQGSVVGETNTSGVLQQTFKANEFGVPSGSQPSSGYGWLGGKERKAQFASGVTTMGQRIYVPESGRFLQTDPVPGGSANDYDYVNQDPLDGLDLQGTRPAGRGAAGGLHEMYEKCRRAGGCKEIGIHGIVHGAYNLLKAAVGGVFHRVSNSTVFKGIQSIIRGYQGLHGSVRHALACSFDRLEGFAGGVMALTGGDPEAPNPGLFDDGVTLAQRGANGAYVDCSVRGSGVPGSL